ncbi:MAG: hypothetical protein DRH57_00165 [Candidatus Cloacimonadota bacterium]|nr:MAG: hypothetical protein DRH57_00165 [Candidatus Cloacimonadota bacterium]
MELIIKSIEKMFLKSGEKSSNVDKGKLIVDRDKLIYKNGKEIEVELERVEKEKSYSLLYARLELEGGIVAQLNVYELKRKEKKNQRKKSSSLI